jgi:hypothetical protein
MWSEWNRWWSRRGAPAEGPPDEIVVPTSESENDRDASDEANLIESESGLNVVEGAIPAKSEHADVGIPESAQPAEHAHEPNEATDLADATAPAYADAWQPPRCDDLAAEEPAGSPAANDWESPAAGLDPVAELSRRRLGLAAGKGRTRRGRRLNRPGGPLGPTPEASWTARGVLSLDKRKNMWHHLKSGIGAVLDQRNIDPTATLPHYTQTEIERIAAQPVLEELGLLDVTRRRIAPVF